VYICKYKNSAPSRLRENQNIARPLGFDLDLGRHTQAQQLVTVQAAGVEDLYIEKTGDRFHPLEASFFLLSMIWKKS
jgi:hypothetical protein